MRKNLPNLLTFSRVLVIPLIILAIFFPQKPAHWIATLLFIVACVTDFMDGHLARRWSIVSPLGRFLDPVADKLLVCSTLLMLVGTGAIRGLSLLPAVIILCREIIVSGLREFLAELHVGMPVSWGAKWKTAIQMIALGCLLIGDAGPFFPPLVWKVLGISFLWMAAGLTVYTGYDYLKAAKSQMGHIWMDDTTS